MTRKDDAPTYHVVIRHKDGPVHLSDNGSYTLCYRRISYRWQRHDERVTKFALLFSGVRVCDTCWGVAATDAAPQEETE